MTDYKGPERRAVITFTREDSDRLVRLEQQIVGLHQKIEDVVATQLAWSTKQLTAQNIRITKVEKLQSWIMGIGAAVTFMISTAVLWLSGKH